MHRTTAQGWSERGRKGGQQKRKIGEGVGRREGGGGGVE